MAASGSYRLILSARALGQIEAVRVYLHERNPQAATRVIATLRKAFRPLSGRPNMGRPGSEPGTREWSVVRFPYVIVYNVAEEDQSLTIMGVFHTAQGERKL